VTKSISLLHHQPISSDTTNSEIINILLKNRQIIDSTEFLAPQYPNLDLDLSPAKKIIQDAITNQKNILVYGDYDVDGITATAILWQSLYQHTKNVFPFVPHREKDGYGIKAKSFFRFQEEKGIKFDLLITVDNGIVASSELQKIKSHQDVQIIITDHHLQSADDGLQITDYDALIHSTEVSGATISWFLAREFDKNADLGLAALGAVADCLPLVGINRSIVVHGLQKINSNPSIGLQKLIQISGAKQPINSYHLGFLIGPRINAVGRLSDPTDALRLLCSSSLLQASRYAQSLNSFNQDRQVLQKVSIDLAEESISRDAPVGRLIGKKSAVSGKIKNKIIIISGDYNPGIIGLIAGRLTEKYYLPSIVMSVDGDIAKGSCRSIPELNIIDSLRQHSKLFIDLGGHSGAAGFSILTKNIPTLKSKLTKSINAKLAKINLVPHLNVDAQIDLSLVTIPLIKAISALEPFGIGNPQPLFLFKNIIIQDVRTIGQTNDHLKLDIRVDRCVRPFKNSLHPISGIAFKKGELITTFKKGDSVDIVASLSINEWDHTLTPQLIIKEILNPN
jgi:single-stranded-DNA-specific exonuclease